MAEGLAAQGPSNPMSVSPQPVDTNFFACRDCGRIYNKTVIAETTVTCKTCGNTKTFYKDRVCPECVELEKIKARDAVAAIATKKAAAEAAAAQEAKDKAEKAAHDKQLAEEAEATAKADAETKAALAKTEAEAKAAAAKYETDSRAAAAKSAPKPVEEEEEDGRGGAHTGKKK